jgi:hypothetical protein
LGVLAVAIVLRIGLIAEVINRWAELASTAFVWTSLLLDFVFFTYTAIGAFIASRRPWNAVGWIFIGIGMSWDLLGVSRTALGQILREPSVVPLDPLTWPASAWPLSLLANAWAITFVLVPALFLVFPSGRLLSSRWTPVAWLAVADAVIGLITGTTQLNRNVIGFPLLGVAFGETGDLLRHVGSAAAAAGMIALFPLAVGALVTRSRRSRATERTQLLWFSYACVLLVVVFVVLSVLWLVPATRVFDPDAPFPVAMFLGIPFALAVVALPIASAVAIFRHQLFDIDLLINRTLVYGVTTATLIATYALTVLVAQTLLHPVTQGSELAVAASTLATAALIQPVRRRVQRTVDRRFYRSRYDAARTLDALAARLRDEVDLGALRRELIRAVSETMEPAHASVWLRERAR